MVISHSHRFRSQRRLQFAHSIFITSLKLTRWSRLHILERPLSTDPTAAFGTRSPIIRSLPIVVSTI
ncbi:hypothetical protein HanHA300_Chr17g0637441 [Helianthus annuus]|nr:hypothetical protein HanHA300_Chr17g0637441 [Helianthus annuus]KAJ0445926.1 hypothetical protein HanHA89_Chr17g0688731 [Helianthus annuus]KAJ0630890.1 hypothetical protein HanLR1_Chr17g0648101 [Helianthus annuus]KAJ0634744.1 hypothetical protein HanOQP8_Chr17g0643341 [Helianthus annuus]